MSATSEGVKSSNTEAADRQSPIVLDLGKHKRKWIKRLRNGEGKLLDEALDSIEELQRVGTIPKDAQPVIIVVREKAKSNRMLPMLCR